MTDGRTTPAARLDELTRLYERHAYVVWNIALRTTLDDEAARAGARRAFTAQVSYPDEGRLALDAGRHAVDAAGGVDARTVEDPLLAATTHLAAVQRAVLALAELTDVPPSEVAAQLGIEVERERELRDRAYEQLGLLLGVTEADARAAYADVPWVEPPAELWQALYPELHGAVTQQAQAAAEPAPVAAVSTDRSAARTRGRRRLRSGALAGIAALAIAGVAWAAGGGGDDGSGASDAGTQGYTGVPGSTDDAYSSDDAAQDESAESATSLLTPEELDKLRREEIEQLKRLTRRQADRDLPQQKRDRAARQVSELVKLAQARQRAAEERELALRRQLAREREARMRERSRRQDDQDQAPAGEPPPPEEKQTDEGRQPTGDEKSGGEGDRDPVETECLYDPSNGTYICPE